MLTDSDALFHKCMDPYRAKDCIYLRSAEVQTSADTEVKGVSDEAGPAGIISRGTFEIPESCYIDDTGHFNAVEFIICYNQLMYLSLAATVDAGDNPIFEGWTIDEYWERQLPAVLIQQADSRYSRPINARGFQAEFRVVELDATRLERGILKLRTEIEFTDDNGGRARGEVRLALVNTPEAGLKAAARAADHSA
ncbi:FcoT family thioesterase [Corynebacterium sp. TAE3-ERU12]|uniref:FcoT family thioesterase n=1 Tax=Corynebacterium sp. TAE3-ERU12 TaxID=2849491 RepID=UPI001C46B412|nr:FcoT family thioesterase [Corynebacterium sp. TAE3-ERU12]